MLKEVKCIHITNLFAIMYTAMPSCPGYFAGDFFLKLHYAKLTALEAAIYNFIVSAPWKWCNKLFIAASYAVNFA